MHRPRAGAGARPGKRHRRTHNRSGDHHRRPECHRQQPDPHAGAIGKGVDRGHNPDPGQGRGPQGGQTGGNQQDRDQTTRQPAPGHPVQRRSAEQPGHQTCRLDRVPGPVAAPAKFDVGPHRPRSQTRRQHRHRPRHRPTLGQRPWSAIILTRRTIVTRAAGATVSITPAGRDNNGHRVVRTKGEGGGGQGGDEQPDQAGVKQRWVPDHGWILQHRLQPQAVDRGHVESLERRRRQHQHQSVGGGKPRPQPQNPSSGPDPGRESTAEQNPGRHRSPGHHDRPQQQRSLGAGPRAREAQQRTGPRAGMVGHVGQGPDLGHEGHTKSDKQGGAHNRDHNIDSGFEPPLGEQHRQATGHHQAPQAELGQQRHHTHHDDPAGAPTAVGTGSAGDARRRPVPSARVAPTSRAVHTLSGSPKGRL